MIKLVKEVDNTVAYWEVWKDGKKLTVHSGFVGETGEAEEVKLKMFERAEKIMEELAEEKLAEGYDYLDEDELIELVLQYPYEEQHMEKALEKRQQVEDLMNNCLGWTGNGACDGGDIGSGTTNIFNYVIDVEKALKTILEELTEENLLANVKIAFLDEDEEYIGLYPKGTEFDI
ncbi:hypothetical protein [Planomicrobium okeanokoites]|uniref:WGR domain-containing protein n=1 Tax=Planomicrobium okeanokoites TaxID=244 RepID=A0ABV7KKJ8_PLAOK|nr:hypothetical protein [Planomicrobium okeanokoites]TAA68910.1 hypothetical protein D2910_10790 [Planomicrobium okeanokoites]